MRRYRGYILFIILRKSAYKSAKICEKQKVCELGDKHFNKLLSFISPEIKRSTEIEADGIIP
jgi:hypothetical protein